MVLNTINIMILVTMETFFHKNCQIDIFWNYEIMKLWNYETGPDHNFVMFLSA